MSLSVRHKQNAGLRIAVNVSPRRRTCVPVKCRQRLAERRRGHYCKYPSAYLPKAVHRFCQKPSIPGRKTTRALSQTSVLVSPYSGTRFYRNPSTPGRKTTRTLLQVSVRVSAQSGTSFLPKAVHTRQKDDASIITNIRPRICPKRYIVSVQPFLAKLSIPDRKPALSPPCQMRRAAFC